jgi:hypothetical protein
MALWIKDGVERRTVFANEVTAGNEAVSLSTVGMNALPEKASVLKFASRTAPK